MKYKNIREEELKNKVVKDFFWLFESFSILNRKLRDELKILATQIAPKVNEYGFLKG